MVAPYWTENLTATQLKKTLPSVIASATDKVTDPTDVHLLSVWNETVEF
jgi:hypothetical protein